MKFEQALNEYDNVDVIAKMHRFDEYKKKGGKLSKSEFAMFIMKHHKWPPLEKKVEVS
jgi:hypothetical protein